MSNICFTFQETGQCQYGDECRFSHAVGGAPQQRQQREPRQPREPREPRGDGPDDRLSCFQWRDSGSCQYGDNCRFSHGEQPTAGSRRKGQEPCYTFRDTGSCRFGDGCRYSHDPAVQGGAPAPRQQRAPREDRPPRAPREQAAPGGGGICYSFRDSGVCRFGDGCRFSHDAAQAGGDF